jgi:DNA-binding CsgD family transcriptional regulator
MTKREKEIIFLVANDMDNVSIAKALNISVKTAETHRRNIMRKMKAKTAAGMVAIALRTGIISL